MEEKKHFVVTIDGPAGVGKSSVSSAAAKALDAAFLDTGAMYRAVTFAAMKDGVDLTKEAAVLEVLNKRLFFFDVLNGIMTVAVDDVDITDDIRYANITANVKYIASAPKVRERLVEMQRDFAANHARIVTEGRDQGTVAFPDAEFKFFLTADVEERAKRRKTQLKEKGIAADMNELIENIQKRDSLDTQRQVGPLKPAADAVIVDTTSLGFDQVVEKILEHIEKNV